MIEEWLIEIAKIVDNEKLMTTGEIIRVFRERGKLELLKEAIPYMNTGNQLAITSALCAELPTNRRPLEREEMVDHDIFVKDDVLESITDFYDDSEFFRSE